MAQDSALIAYIKTTIVRSVAQNTWFVKKCQAQIVCCLMKCVRGKRPIALNCQYALRNCDVDWTRRWVKFKKRKEEYDVLAGYGSVRTRALDGTDREEIDGVQIASTTKQGHGGNIFKQSEGLKDVVFLSRGPTESFFPYLVLADRILKTILIVAYARQHMLSEMEMIC